MSNTSAPPPNIEADAPAIPFVGNAATSNRVALSARAALAAGYVPVPIPSRSKSPNIPKWQDLRVTADADVESAFPPGSNIGLNLGPSKLVDADLDSAWALALADAVLPKSTMIWGRKSKPASHRAYRVPSAAAVKYRKYTGVDDKVTFLERRAGAGKQTVIPPSVHPSGEAIEYVAPGPAADVDPHVLAEAFDDLGAAALIASILRDGARHDIVLAIAGFLVKAGCPEQRVRRILEPVVHAFDDEPDDRLRAIDDTISRYHAGAPVAGFSKLCDVLSDDVARRVASKLSDWLGLNAAAGSDLPVIDTRPGMWGAIAEAGYAALVARNLNESAPVLFQMAGRIARVRVHDDGRPEAEVVSDPALRGRLAREIVWLGPGRMGPKLIQPPDFVVKDIQARAAWPGLPVLRGVVEFPFFTSDGVLSTTPGYQRDAKVWYHDADVDVPSVPSTPADGDVAIALDLLLKHLLVDFPFDSESSRVHMVGLLLTPFVREMIPGPVPLHIVTAPVIGSGKSLLNQIFGIVLTGRDPKMTTPPRTEEEWRKVITSTLLAGPTHITLDNVSTKLDSGALAEVLTSGEHTDRLLGVSKNVSVLNRAVWVATGNNVQTSTEIARRSVWIKLRPNVEHPHLRGECEFTHHPLHEWAREGRGPLIGALLTLAQAWVARGRPAFTGGRSKGSFEAWVRVIGGILDIAGVGGAFLENDRGMFEAADEETAELSAFVAAWAERFRDTPVTAAYLDSLIEDGELLATVLPLDGKSPKGRQTSIGAFVRRLDDRIIAGWRVRTKARGGDGARGWSKSTTYRLVAPSAA